MTVSLNWDMTKVRDYEALHSDADLMITQVIVFGCMSTGIGALDTDENVAEYIVRAKFLQLLDGPWLYGPDGPLEVTPSDIKRRRGLSTNVFPTETRAKWLKRVVSGQMDRDVADHLRRIKDQRDAEALHKRPVDALGILAP